MCIDNHIKFCLFYSNLSRKHMRHQTDLRVGSISRDFINGAALILTIYERAV